MDRRLALKGCLIGAAIGDALGLPYEGLAPRRIARMAMASDVTIYRFIAKRGMVSDDTEHLSMVAQALIVSAGDPERFLQSLSRQLRWWLAGVPAGIGLATLRATLRLWLGVSPLRSGVFSAGNGPAMRSAILGVCYGDDPEQLHRLVRLSTHVTHTDPKAEQGALAIAIAAYCAYQTPDITPSAFQSLMEERLGESASEFLGLTEAVIRSVEQGETTADFAQRSGYIKGVSGYIFHTVPIVIHLWLRYRTDLLGALREAILCGGDTDTVAAIAGGVIGAGADLTKLPSRLQENLLEYPRNTVWLERLADRLDMVMTTKKPQSPLPISPLLLLLRNAAFAIFVLCHGLRRLAPPY